NWPAVNAAARVIKKLSQTTDHSEGNFHFAANASVPPYSAFFPGAYHTGSGRQFAIGLASAVEDTAQRIDREQGWIYLGLDLSPASSQGASIGAAIETISKQPLGSS